MENEFGFSRRILHDLKKATDHLNQAQEHTKHATEAYIELERAIEVLDQAILREMRAQRVKDWAGSGKIIDFEFGKGVK